MCFLLHIEFPGKNFSIYLVLRIPRGVILMVCHEVSVKNIVYNIESSFDILDIDAKNNCLSLYHFDFPILFFLRNQPQGVLVRNSIHRIILYHGCNLNLLYCY